MCHCTQHLLGEFASPPAVTFLKAHAPGEQSRLLAALLAGLLQGGRAEQKGGFNVIS